MWPKKPIFQNRRSNLLGMSHEIHPGNLLNLIAALNKAALGLKCIGIIQQFCEQNIFPILDPLAMQELYFEKRNCTIEHDHAGNLILTLLDWQKQETIEDHVSKMLLSLKEKGKNKVLWWNNRSIFLCAKNQYQFINSVQ